MSSMIEHLQPDKLILMKAIDSNKHSLLPILKAIKIGVKDHSWIMGAAFNLKGEFLIHWPERAKEK
jgi:hypothetical protein